MRRPVRAHVLAVAVAAALTGCSGGTAHVVAPAAPDVASDPLPEGDPGTSAPEAPEPSGEGDAHDDHAEHARTHVPVEAMLDASTLAAVAGGSWQVQPVQAGDAEPCGPMPAGAGATRTTRLADAAGRVVVQTVLSYDHGADGAAVQALGSGLARCGWQSQDPLVLGEQAVQATRGHDDRQAVLLGLSAEGVVVVLTGHGGAASDAAVWQSVADVALGTACPAAPAGCH